MAGLVEKVKYFGDFANQKLGKALNGGLSGGIQNEYAYLRAPGDHSVAGVVSSFAGGSTTGALSPVTKTGNRAVDFVLDRPKDYVSGVINYSSANLDHWKLEEANAKGLSSVEKGFAKGIGKEANTSLKILTSSPVFPLGHKYE